MLDLKEAAADAVLAHPDLGHEQVAPSGSSTPPRPAPAATVDEAIEAARADGIVIEREYRQQRLIPSFMEPRSVVVDPTGEQLDHLDGHPDARISCASSSPPSSGIPE